MNVNKYFDLGFKIFPAHIWLKKMPDGSTEKCFMFGKKDTDYSHWRHNNHTIDTFRARWLALDAMVTPANSICMECGQPSGCTVVDRDMHPKSTDILKKYAPNIFEGPYDKSPRGGNHFYFKYVAGARTVANPSIGIDVRNDGGLLVMPPSIISTGKYEWVNPIINLFDLPEFPPALFGFLFGSGAYQKHFENATSKEKPNLSEIESMLAIMSGIRYGYDDWLRIISSLWSVYTLEETEGILKKYLPEERPNEYRYKYDRRLIGGLTIGTFIHYYNLARKEWSPVPSIKPLPVIINANKTVLQKGDPNLPYWSSYSDYDSDHNILSLREILCSNFKIKA